MTPDDLFALMDDISEVPDSVKDVIRNLPTVIAARQIAAITIQIGTMIEHDIEELDRFIDDIDDHLLEIPHSPESSCWADRAHAISMRSILNEKLEACERVAAAVMHYANPNGAN